MNELDGQLRLHDEFRHSLVAVGRERAPVLVIDNFLSRAEVLVDYAAARGAFEGVTDTFYPGVRAPIPAIYCFAVRAFLGPLIGVTFGLAGRRVTGELAHFSLVTKRPDELDVLQRMPHVDCADPGQLAVLHYLCAPAQGGTSFYRHRTTGFESLDASRMDAYRTALSAELNAHGPPAGAYICGDDAVFERTASFDAAFNRVLVYRSVGLHSADIGTDFAFDGSPRTGRLTANTFLLYR